MQDHRKLHAYQAARNLAVQVYTVARGLPSDERYELARQLRRAAVSVGSNIAEGCGRTSRQDFANFLGLALGSSRELEFQLEICRALALCDPAVVDAALETNLRVGQMLSRLILRVRGGGRIATLNREHKLQP